MKPLRFPNKKEQSEYMRMRRDQNLKRTAWLKAENEFMVNYLIPTGIKFKRQAMWGYRLFDFWSHEKGVAIEIDGPEHRADYDAHRDLYNFLRSGIIVLRVKNFDPVGSEQAIEHLKNECTWEQRRGAMEILCRNTSGSGRRQLARNDDKNEALLRIDQAGLYCTYGKPTGPSVQPRFF
jgi:very-short-patch-repair endonuclease